MYIYYLIVNMLLALFPLKTSGFIFLNIYSVTGLEEYFYFKAYSYRWRTPGLLIILYP